MSPDPSPRCPLPLFPPFFPHLLCLIRLLCLCGFILFLAVLYSSLFLFYLAWSLLYI
jgi:hypothetical protein